MNRNHQPTVARRTERLVVRKFGDETVVYDLSTERVTALDADTAAVWSAADGSATLSDIEAATGQSEEDVAAALVKLDDADLLKDTGVSRRVLLKRIGLVGAGVVALPMITAAPAWAACSTAGARTVSATSSCNTTTHVVTISVSIAGAFTEGDSITVTLPYRKNAGGDGASNATATTSIKIVNCQGSGTLTLSNLDPNAAAQTRIVNAKNNTPGRIGEEANSLPFTFSGC